MPSIIKYSGPVKIDFASLSGKGARIGLIDSGVCTRRFGYAGARAFGDRTSNDATPAVVQDTIGHGTACAGIIRSIAPDAEIVVAKVFHKDLSAPTNALVSAIEWLADHDVSVINLSLGTVQPRSKLKSLESVCDKAALAGITIVSANCNAQGKTASPAQFESVIGVDAAALQSPTDFYYRPNGANIEILAKGDRQILDWVEPDSIFMGGTSFACPKISALVALMAGLFENLTPTEIRSLLRANSIAEPPQQVFDESLSRVGTVTTVPAAVVKPYANPRKQFIEDIKKAVIYPYNKEMHSLVRFRHTLSYEISGVVDFIGKRTIGKDAAETLGLPKSGIVISGKFEAELEKADTLILGYVDELERITKKSIFDRCIKTAVEMGKRIYSLVPVNKETHPELFEYLTGKQAAFCSPVVDMQAFKDLATAFAPNVHSEKPIVAVFGTGPQQGKFTVQLALKEQFAQKGYKVGHLSTEHQGELVGADVVFPTGYASFCNLQIPFELHIPFLRSALRSIEADGVDLTICGAQSGIIPFSYGDFSQLYTLPSLVFLMGVLPDAAVLCVNLLDTDEFILDCIKAIEIVGKTKVVALVFSDKRKVVRPVTGGSAIGFVPMDEGEVVAAAERLNALSGLPACMATALGGAGPALSDILEGYLAK